MSKLIEIIGWYGVSAVIGAYFLLSFSILKADEVLCHALNATGAMAIGAASLIKKAWQPTVSNLIWTLIALVAIAKILFFK